MLQASSEGILVSALKALDPTCPSAIAPSAGFFDSDGDLQSPAQASAGCLVSWFISNAKSCQAAEGYKPSSEGFW